MVDFDALNAYSAFELQKNLKNNSAEVLGIYTWNDISLRLHFSKLLRKLLLV